MPRSLGKDLVQIPPIPQEHLPNAFVSGSGSRDVVSSTRVLSRFLEGPAAPVLFHQPERTDLRIHLSACSNVSMRGVAMAQYVRYAELSSG